MRNVLLTKENEEILNCLKKDFSEDNKIYSEIYPRHSFHRCRSIARASSVSGIYIVIQSDSNSLHQRIKIGESFQREFILVWIDKRSNRVSCQKCEFLQILKYHQGLPPRFIFSMTWIVDKKFSPFHKNSSVFWLSENSVSDRIVVMEETLNLWNVWEIHLILPKLKLWDLMLRKWEAFL